MAVCAEPVLRGLFQFQSQGLPLYVAGSRCCSWLSVGLLCFVSDARSGALSGAAARGWPAERRAFASRSEASGNSRLSDGWGRPSSGAAGLGDTPLRSIRIDSLLLLSASANPRSDLSDREDPGTAATLVAAYRSRDGRLHQAGAGHLYQGGGVLPTRGRYSSLRKAAATCWRMLASELRASAGSLPRMSAVTASIPVLRWK